MKKNSNSILSILFTLTICSSLVSAGPPGEVPNGQPFQALQEQVEQLQGQLDALSQGVEVTVACGTDTINGALTTYKNYPGTLTITVDGTCNENVVINRNNVTLQGPGTIKSVVLDDPVIWIAGYNGIFINGLNIYSSIFPSKPSQIVSGGDGVFFINNASGKITNTVISGFNAGVISAHNSGLEVTNSTVSGNLSGLISIRGGFIRLANMQVIDNTLNLTASDQGGISFINEANISSTISEGIEGLRLRRGGYTLINGTTVNFQDNIRGIHILGNGLLEGGDDVIISNNVRGIVCSEPLTITLETLHSSDSFLGNATFINNTVADVHPDCFPGPI